MKSNIADKTLFTPLPSAGTNEVFFQGRKLVHYSGCDYFRLSLDARLAAAAKKSLAETGLNVAASRLTTGDRAIYHELENRLQKFFRCEAALILSDGYLAPLAAAQAFAGEFTHAFMDERAHGALVDAANLLGCPVQKFSHRDPADLGKKISRGGKNFRPVVLTDGMFSADGSIAPLRAYLKLLPRDGRILLDDAHGVGLLGANGRGTVELENTGYERVIQCGTLSKAFGAFGGIVLSSGAVREKILARSRSFVGATPLPPPLAGAGVAAVKILTAEKSRRKRVQANTHWLRSALQKGGWKISETPGPIVRLPDLTPVEESQLKQILLAAGIYPPFLKYGAAAKGYFRFVVSSEHTPEQLKNLAGVLAGFISTSR
ncbi:MAG TPA: pyridoxal phosphate-dependent aminotransferase family protein [Candidatus Sulfotelmatobacter sp.]|nr:pyridoxal phosphate-dependent aminotransferase family protein [Candidatus Sulfotelmatobacter sp.]